MNKIKISLILIILVKKVSSTKLIDGSRMNAKKDARQMSNEQKPNFKDNSLLFL